MRAIAAHEKEVRQLAAQAQALAKHAPKGMVLQASRSGDDGPATVLTLTGDTITGQMGDALDLDPVTLDRQMFSDGLIRDLGGDPEAQGLS